MKTELFSPREEKILKVLGKRKMTIGQLTTKVFAKKKQPLNGQTMVASAVRSINSKCKYHKQAWFLNGMGVGRKGKTIWKDKH